MPLSILVSLLLPQRWYRVLDDDDLTSGHGWSGTTNSLGIVDPELFNDDLLPRYVTHFLECKSCVEASAVTQNRPMMVT